MPHSLRGVYMHVPRGDLALEYFLQWLECTMLACDLVSIRLFGLCSMTASTFGFMRRRP
jgi:hypothetical protein